MKALLCLSLQVSLLIGHASFAYTGATANELPEDTNKIESLTPEQARKLVNNSRGVRVPGLNAKGTEGPQPKRPPRFHNCLMLSGLKHLDADTAAVIASFRGEELRLDGLESLGPDVAKALADFSGILRLDGLKTLDPATAAAFEPAHVLSLGGLSALDAATAKELSRGKGFLFLDGLTAIDVAVAAALAEREGGLSLAALITPNADALKVLAGFRGQWLLLHCPQTLTKQLATVLTGYKGSCLVLTGLTTLDAGEADWIANLKCQAIYLEDVTNIQDPHARALAAFNGQDMYLPGVIRLDAAAAGALALWKGKFLDLDGLKAIDAPTAKALVAFDAGGPFGPKRGQSRLSLEGLTSLDADTIKALTNFKGDTLSLTGLTALGAEAFHVLAKADADYEGDLFLDVGALLAANPLTPDSASSWAALSKGDMASVTALDAATAKSLAEFRGQHLSLDGLTTLDSVDSIAVAKALAAYKGRLRLPNLKKISPKTLAALLEKEDVEIPLIETLELIQEPDGSPTEDFVIPEAFQNK